MKLPSNMPLVDWKQVRFDLTVVMIEVAAAMFYCVACFALVSSFLLLIAGIIRLAIHVRITWN